MELQEEGLWHERKAHKFFLTSLSTPYQKHPRKTWIKGKYQRFRWSVGVDNFLCVWYSTGRKGWCCPMMYPFLQIDGDTEIVHSDTLPNGEVKVYIEKPDAKDGFHHASCFLPAYRWEDICGFTPEEIARYQEVIESTAHLILEFARQGGFENASGL
ncbi:hypothetical protein [Oscillibacter valericigenes]|nr:hypothetical protein [Oscillibacter valericigenes]